MDKLPRKYNRAPSDRALEALRLREIGLSFAQIGQKLGVTRQRAQQLVLQAGRPVDDSRGEAV